MKLVITFLLFVFTSMLSGQNLITHISFDNIVSDIAIDSVNNNPGWIKNAIPVQGVLGDAIYFNTGGGFVQIGTVGWNLNSGTILMWINRQDDHGVYHQYMFGHHYPDSTWNNKIQIYINRSNDSLGLGMGDSHYLNSRIAEIKMNQWYHLALTWQDSIYRFYVDGEYKESGVYHNFNFISSFADIGNDGNTAWRNEYFGGYIDDVRIYNSLLTQNQIQTLIRNDIPPSPELRTHINHAKFIWEQTWHPDMRGFEFRCMETSTQKEYLINLVEILSVLGVDTTTLDTIYECQTKAEYIPGTDSLWKYNVKYTIDARAIAEDLNSVMYSVWSDPAIGYFMHGDFNSDWNIDGLDLILFSSEFGISVVEIVYEDLNQDGIVDGLDLILFAKEFSKSWSP